MFCYQCEQTWGGHGCTRGGVCGKSPEVSDEQDLIQQECKDIARVAHRAREFGKETPEADRFVEEALFITVTNVNFDPDRMLAVLEEGESVFEETRSLYETAAGADAERIAPAFGAISGRTREELLQKAAEIGIEARMENRGKDITGLEELLVYGIKGVASYSWHARVLGHTDDAIYEFIHRALSTVAEHSADTDTLFALNLECGDVALKTMALLDEAHTDTFGTPEPTEILRGHVPGKAILVSGHDLKDLKELLEQTEGTGINIYTHGEMMPAHGYPELKKHLHLVGNYGGAWQNQRTEFDDFPGPVVMTTNCLMPPKKSYADRVFTANVVGFSNLSHLRQRDFTPVIETAREMEGFTDTVEHSRHMAGFAHGALLSQADALVGAIKDGAVGRILYIGGCDGSEKERNVFTDLAREAPDNWVILTSGCGKYRILDAVSGKVGDFPRLLDCGQCNDTYSAIKVAGALAEAFDTDVNGLPLSLAVSWFEQKAVCILLALLNLGVKDIRLGPRLPAFVTENMLSVLSEKFDLKPMGNPTEEIQAMAAE